MRIREAVAAAAARLAGAGVPEAGRDARWLAAAAAGIPRDRLTLHLDDPLSGEAGRRFEAMLAARLARRPMAQILGERAFHGRAFAVTPEVLDPRPETEVLVARALEAPFRRLLDLGTGSGCIAVTLLAERPEATGVATDVAPGALAVAAANAARHGVADRLELRRADWFAGVEGRFDLIVSNPPYIAAAEMDALQPEVRDFEPRVALTDEGDGLSAYRAIAAGARGHLLPGGRILVEIGPGQGAAVAELFRAARLDAVAVHPDLDGRDRVVSGCCPIPA